MKKTYKLSSFYRLLTIILTSVLIISNSMAPVFEAYAAESVSSVGTKARTVESFSYVKSETYTVGSLLPVKSELYTINPLSSYNLPKAYAATQLAATSTLQLEDYMFGSQLTGLSKLIYDTLFVKATTISTNSITVDVTKNTYSTSSSYQISAAMQLALNAIMDDFPFYSWIYISDGTNSGTTYTIESSNGYVTQIVINPVLSPYFSSVSQVKAAFQAEDAALTALIQSMPSSANTRYKRIEYIHDYLVDNVTYDAAALNAYMYNSSSREASYGYAWMAYGALVKKTCVCEGYAKAFKLACDRLGIPCQIVIGDAGGAHMWNHVQMEDGKWYAVDSTFDDPTFSYTPTQAQIEQAKDEYFIVGKNVLNSVTPVHSYTGSRGYYYSTLSDTSYDSSKQVTEPLVVYTDYLHERYAVSSSGGTTTDSDSSYDDLLNGYDSNDYDYSNNNDNSYSDYSNNYDYLFGDYGTDYDYIFSDPNFDIDAYLDSVLEFYNSFDYSFTSESDYDFSYSYDFYSNYDTDFAVPPTINYTSKTIYVNKKLSLEISDLASGAQVTYSSSNPEVAKVSSTGRVTGVSVGSAKIKTTVKQNGQTYKFTTKIKVKEPYIKFTKKVSTIKVGDSFLLKVKRYGFKSPVTFSVNKSSYASIEKQGTLTAKFTAKKAGTVNVTASAGGMSVTFQVKIVR